MLFQLNFVWHKANINYTVRIEFVTTYTKKNAMTTKRAKDCVTPKGLTVLKISIRFSTLERDMQLF